MEWLLKPEDELLLCCSRMRREIKIAWRVKALLRENIGWHYLILTAMMHGVMPLLYKNINSILPEAVPKSDMVLLRNNFYTNFRSNLYLVKELSRLLDQFEAQGIPAIPIKGPTLAQFVYGNPAFRQLGDLDILVHRRYVIRVKNIMLSLGYRPEFQLTPAQGAAYLQSNCECCFSHKQNGIRVELKWQIAPKFFSLPLDIEQMYGRHKMVSLGGREVPTLSPEDLLLLLCMHGARHRWERLIWICDVAELINVHNEMHWEQVMRQTYTMDSTRMLFLGLKLVNELFDAALPKSILHKMHGDPAVESLSLQVKERLFDYAQKRTRFLTDCLFKLRLMHRLQDRIRYCFHRLFTPTERDWEYLSLPSSMYFFYYLFRPIRLAGDSVFGMFTK